MNNKLDNMINEFMANSDAKDLDELNKELQEFLTKYNNDDEIEYENTPLDDAYELLEKAETTKSKKQAIKFAKEAYEMCPECFDALLFQVDFEENALKREKLLNEGLEFERKRLDKEGYFEKDNIGHFYGIFETRPYIRGLYIKVLMLLKDGKIKQGMHICKEILKLNNNDNTGARYLLMAIYAFLENEDNMLKLYKKFPEEHLEMLFPLFALYYKLGNDKKCIEYLNKINKSNPYFIKYFTDGITNESYIEDGYQKGKASEILMYFENYDFLTDTIPNIDEYIIENINK